MGPEGEDTREELATQLELLASQVREHGVLRGWEIDIHAESILMPSGRFMNRVPTGLHSYTVKYDVDRSQAWRDEALNRG